MCGYVLARYSFPGSKLLYRLDPFDAFPPSALQRVPIFELMRQGSACLTHLMRVILAMFWRWRLYYPAVCGLF